MSVKWLAYCIECQRELGTPCANGGFAEAAASIHLKREESKDHQIIIGIKYNPK